MMIIIIIIMVTVAVFKIPVAVVWTCKCYFYRTPLMYACLIGLRDAVLTLLQHGANPLLRDTNGHLGRFLLTSV